jgi:GNAT superfamily N-acetyltransferase
MLLRPAESGDEMGVARVHIRSWQAAYRKLLPDDYLEQLRPEDRAQKYTFGNPHPFQPHTIVAVDAGEIHGFATTMPSRDLSMPGYGELVALYVDPAHWGRGLGVALVSAARAHLFASGFRHALLWVLAGNVRADRFYRTDQWSPDGMRRIDTVWDVQVEEFRYQRALSA